MTDDIDALSGWAEPLLRKMQPTERRKLMKSIARELRKSNQERMKKQEGPNGESWEPRKSRIGGKSGGIRKKAMFTKIRTSKFLRINTSPDVAGLLFSGAVGRIARIHHYGLRAKVDKNGPEYDYPSRPLLGTSRQDLDMIAEKILEHVTL